MSDLLFRLAVLILLFPAFGAQEKPKVEPVFLDSIKADTSIGVIVSVAHKKCPSDEHLYPKGTYLFVMESECQLVAAAKADGQIIYGPAFKGDESAKQFWAELAKYYPLPCLKEKP